MKRADCCLKKAGRGIGAALVLAAFLAGACVSLPGDRDTDYNAASPGRTGNRAERPGDDGLDSPWFRDLPAEAKTYLKTLAKAVRDQDWEFLVSQGEPRYENDVRSRYGDEIYLALLYRIGPYSEDSPNSRPELPRFDYKTIEAIQYTDWTERGPMLDISGRFYRKDGGPIPCGIILIWRLEELRILGFYP